VSDLLLAERTVLLHIGPYKTGTTALQGALRQARPAMAEHGVVYAGKERQHMRAALAVRGAKGLTGDPTPPIAHWNRLVRQVEAASDERVIVSSEFFTESSSEIARKVVDGLGGERVHVLVTLRPLAKIMPSSWQQYVRNGQRTSYDEWLDCMLNKPPYRHPTPTFWKRHRHEVLVERWASIVGPERLTVAVVDDADRLGLMRTVEQLVGLPEGLLVPEDGWTNRSLTMGEAELVRQLNVEFKRRAWPATLYKDVVRLGLVQHMQMERTPGPEEARINTPAWALERAAEIGAAAAEKIAALGVRVVGDLSLLAAAPKAREDADTTPAAVLPVSAAAEAVTAAVLATVPPEVLQADTSAEPQNPKPVVSTPAGSASSTAASSTSVPASGGFAGGAAVTGRPAVRRPVPLERRLARKLSRTALGQSLRLTRPAAWLRGRLRSRG
jgi:hypothetical protein